MEINNLILGNIISLIGCILFFISCRFKKQKHICIMQTIECFITGTSSLIVNGIIGALITYLAGIRNFLGIWKLNGKICVVVCLSLSGLLTIYAYDNIYDLLPFVATVIYTIFLSFKSAKFTKIGTIPNSSLWFIYCLHTGLYINCIFNIVNIIFSIKDIYNKKYLD